MTTASHVVTGLVVGAVFSQNSSIDPLTLIFVSTTSNLLPDVNLFWIKSIREHHRSFTHYPFFWLIFLLALAVMEASMSNQIFWTFLISVNIFLHLIMDTVGLTIGVHWLWPFSNRELSITRLEGVTYNNTSEFWKLFKNTHAFKIELVWNFFVVVLTALIILI